MNKSLKSMPPIASPIGGMMMSLTSDVTTVPNAAPMMTPMARSRTLPRIANSLNSLSTPSSLFCNRLKQQAGRGHLQTRSLASSNDGGRTSSSLHVVLRLRNRAAPDGAFAPSLEWLRPEFALFSCWVRRDIMTAAAYLGESSRKESLHVFG